MPRACRLVRAPLREGERGMSTERDELARKIVDVVRSGMAEGQITRRIRNLLDNYRKPRVVTTAAELDALPVGSVVLPLGKFTAWQKGPSESWYVCGGMLVRESAELLYFGTEWTVLFEPEGGQ